MWAKSADLYLVTSVEHAGKLHKLGTVALLGSDLKTVKVVGLLVVV